MSTRVQQNCVNQRGTSFSQDSNADSSSDRKQLSSYVIPFRRQNAGPSNGSLNKGSNPCEMTCESRDSGFSGYTSFSDQRSYGRCHSSNRGGFPWKGQCYSYVHKRSQIYSRKPEYQTCFSCFQPLFINKKFDDVCNPKESMFGEGKSSLNQNSRRASPIYALRTFTNWAKVKIIQQAVPDSLEKKLTAVDLGCCKGVDLKKWAHSKVEKVYLIDDDKENLEECQARFKEIDQRWPERFKANFIHHDYIYDTVTLTEKVDVVSCHFSVQKAFVTEEEASNFAKNVSNFLKDGGHFVVSVVNATVIKALVMQSEDKKSGGNGMYSVELQKPLTSVTSEFGIRMIFRVHDKFYEEFLLEMSTLERILEQEDMVIVWRKSFLDLYKEACRNEAERKLLNMMGVTKDGVLLMTQTQMQTASLYEAAMFKKVSGNKVNDTTTDRSNDASNLGELYDRIGNFLSEMKYRSNNEEKM